MDIKTTKNKKKDLFNELLITINNAQILDVEEKKNLVEGMSKKCKDYLYTELNKKMKKDKLTKLEEEFLVLLKEDQDPIAPVFSFNFKALSIEKTKPMKLRKGSY